MRSELTNVCAREHGQKKGAAGHLQITALRIKTALGSVGQRAGIRQFTHEEILLCGARAYLSTPDAAVNGAGRVIFYPLAAQRTEAVVIRLSTQLLSKSFAPFLPLRVPIRPSADELIVHLIPDWLFPSGGIGRLEDPRSFIGAELHAGILAYINAAHAVTVDRAAGDVSLRSRAPEPR